MSKKKLLLSFLFFIILIIITFYFIFSVTSLDVFIENFKKINCVCVVICSILVLLYFIFQGLFTKLILKSLNVNISLLKGTYYSIVEYFFSAITPSSTGGQPLQLYYMTKDKIPMRKSLIVLILGTIFFKMFLVIFGLFILIFRRDLIFDFGGIKLLYILGLLVDVFMILLGFLLLYYQKGIKKILYFVYKIVIKFKKKDIDIDKRINELLSNYKQETLYIKRHKKEVLLGLIITFIQRIFMFSIAYVIYRSFGFNDYSYIELLFIQIVAQVSIEALPLPGGTGASELIIKNLYINIFTLTLASTGMLLTRIFSFYLPLLFILLIIIIVTKKFYFKNSN